MSVEEERVGVVGRSGLLREDRLGRKWGADLERG